jgi:hypothetical protein
MARRAVEQYLSSLGAFLGVGVAETSGYGALQALLDPEQAVPGVTTGAARLELATLGVVTRAGGGALNAAAGDLAVTAGCGQAVERAWSAADDAALSDGADRLGLDPATARAALGATTYDVFLNNVASWANVPAGV